MSRLQRRGTIALAAVVVALISSRPADAQIGVDPGPPRESGSLLNILVTGVHYDMVNQAVAERRLQKLQAKLRCDAERGATAAVECDVRRIDKVNYCIAVDEWLIRWNSLQYPGYYPIRTNAMSAAAIAQATHPIPVFYPSQPVTTPTPTPTPIPAPMTAAPRIPITIVNAEPKGDGVAFVIDGVSLQAAGGSRQELGVAPGSKITYDSGGSLGQRRYLISPGVYEFRSTAEGWALYKLASTRGIGDGTHH